MINLFGVFSEWPVITALAVISLTLYFYVNRNLNYWKGKGISGPKPIALMGTMYEYFIKSQPEVELDRYRKYGKIYGIYNGNKPALAVTEPELLKQILVRDFHIFRNRREPENYHPVFVKNLAFAVDDDWKRIRAICSPTFSSGKLKKMYALIQECNNEFMDSLDEYAKNGKEIDLKRIHGAYTLDVIAKCAFATNPNIHKDPENVFNKHVHSLFNFQIWKIGLLFLLPSILSKNPKIQGLLMNLKSFDYFIEVIKHLVKQRKQNNNTNKDRDFLQLLIDAEKSDDISYETDELAANHLNEGKDEIEANIKSLKDNQPNSAERKLTESEIYAQCFVFLLAGYDTTATTLSYCSYELALHPEIQQKMYEEFKTAFDDNGNIEYETLLKLPYLDAVISETLRKYPPVVRLTRIAMNDVVLGDTGITIPNGMLVEMPIYAIHNDPEIYSNPQHFNPERFMPENRSNIKPYTFIPFGTGPRNCIGMRFALVEAKLALANIIKKFIFYKTHQTPDLIIYGKGKRLLGAQSRLIVGIKRRLE